MICLPETVRLVVVAEVVVAVPIVTPLTNVVEAAVHTFPVARLIVSWLLPFTVRVEAVESTKLLLFPMLNGRLGVPQKNDPLASATINLPLETLLVLRPETAKFVVVALVPVAVVKVNF